MCSRWLLIDLLSKVKYFIALIHYFLTISKLYSLSFKWYVERRKITLWLASNFTSLTELHEYAWTCTVEMDIDSLLKLRVMTQAMFL